ncbi:uncharacterized protein LOC141875488 [Acropora palmata]|uniref:uncharacterized protein LOC141875488 n=1 Tax=Acropora palmata TaxID=6131 RepID=UPI003DA1C162
MASAQDNDCLSPYRKFLLDLSSKLLIDDLEKLKFACKDVVPHGKTEEVTAGFKFFDLLEQNGIISPQNLTRLENMMKAIGRADLALDLNKFMIDDSNEMRLGGDDVPDGQRDEDAPKFSATQQDKGDEVVHDGLADDLEKKACTLSLAMDQPLGTSPGVPAARLSSSKPRLSKPEGQGTVQYVNSLTRKGYSVQIVGGKHFKTPEGEFVELKSGTHYEILLKNSRSYDDLIATRYRKNRFNRVCRFFNTGSSFEATETILATGTTIWKWQFSSNGEHQRFFNLNICLLCFRF